MRGAGSQLPALLRMSNRCAVPEQSALQGLTQTHVMKRCGDVHSGRMPASKAQPSDCKWYCEAVTVAQSGACLCRVTPCEGVCAAHTGVQLAAGQVVVSLFSLLPAVTWPHACFGATQYLVASLLTSQSSALGDKLLGGVAYVGLTWWSAALGGAVVRSCAPAYAAGHAGALLGMFLRHLLGLQVLLTCR